MVGSNIDGGDGTTNNKMSNESDNSIVASVEASTSTRNSVHHAYSTLSYYYLEFHAFFFFFNLMRLSSIR